MRANNPLPFSQGGPPIAAAGEPGLPRCGQEVRDEPARPRVAGDQLLGVPLDADGEGVARRLQRFDQAVGGSCERRQARVGQVKAGYIAAPANSESLRGGEM